MRKAWTISLMAAVLPMLGGCVLPPVVTLASYSVDIVTYEATGKTATDHIYSAVARSDCSFIRVLHQEPICVDAPPTHPEESQPADGTERASAAKTTAVPVIQEHDTSVTIGSFLDPANAERAMTRYADYHPAIATALVENKRFHRVVAAHLSADEAITLRAKVAAGRPDAIHRSSNSGTAQQTR